MLCVRNLGSLVKRYLGTRPILISRLKLLVLLLRGGLYRGHGEERGRSMGHVRLRRVVPSNIHWLHVCLLNVPIVLLRLEIEASILIVRHRSGSIRCLAHLEHQLDDVKPAPRHLLHLIALHIVVGLQIVVHIAMVLLLFLHIDDLLDNLGWLRLCCNLGRS